MQTDSCQLKFCSHESNLTEMGFVFPFNSFPAETLHVFISAIYNSRGSENLLAFILTNIYHFYIVFYKYFTMLYTCIFINIDTKINTFITALKSFIDNVS